MIARAPSLRGLPAAVPRSAAAVALTLAATVLGLAIAAVPLVLALLIVAVGGVVVVQLAVRAPTVLFALGLVSLVLLPINGLPLFGVVHPGAVAMLAIAVVSCLGLSSVHQPLRFGIADAGALLFFGVVLLSVPFAGQNVPTTVELAVLWGSAYLAGRAIAGDPLVLLRSLALAGAVAIPFILPELAGINPFRVFGYAVDQSAGVGIDQARLGGQRTEGAFSHPILFAMFLSIAAVAAIGLWLVRDDRLLGRVPRGWLMLGLLLAVLQATTLSRTGWLMLAAVAIPFLVLAPSVALAPRNAVIPLAVVLAAIGSLAVPTTRSLLLGTGSSAAERTALARSTAYRTELRERIFRPGYLAPYGRTTTLVGPGRVKSIDNAYLVIGWGRGYLSLIGFAVIAAGLLLRAVLVRRDPVALMIVLLAIASVALFAQIQVFAWLLFGAAAQVRPRRAAPQVPPRRAAAQLAGEPDGAGAPTLETTRSAGDPTPA